MNVLDSIVNINPLFVLLAVSLAWFVWRFFRREFRTIVVAVWATVFVSFLLLPNGKEISDKAQRLPELKSKAICLGTSLKQGQPWLEKPVSPKCEFTGETSIEPDQGVDPSVKNNLVSRYGDL